MNQSSQTPGTGYSSDLVIAFLLFLGCLIYALFGGVQQFLGAWAGL